MAHPSNSVTRITLLGKLRFNPCDPTAWDEFVEHYSPRILAWCRRWGAQEADAEDITQMVLLKLSQKMGDFSYDATRSFRGWLKTIAHHAWYDFRKNQQRLGQGSGDTQFAQLLDNVEARDDLLKQIDEECARQLLAEAMLLVQLRVAPATWQAFRLTALEGMSGADAGRSLGVPASQVFVYKFRVQKLLEEEMKRLDSLQGDVEPGPAVKDLGQKK